MAAWAYECRPANKPDECWLVGCLVVDEMPGQPRIVRVKVGSEWLCAVVDRTQRVEADRMLLREVIASDEADCPECAEGPPAPTVTE